MKRFALLILVLALPAGCAHVRAMTGAPPERTVLWAQAHDALSDGRFDRAEALFSRLANEHEQTLEGSESVFYLGSIRLDPRNPDWDARSAQDRLWEYLGGARSGRRLYRYPEALILHEIARQLNLPADSRVAGLQPEERVVTVEQRVLVPAQELTDEVERLKQQIADRDARIRQQQEELERIRRTLTPTRP